MLWNVVFWFDYLVLYWVSQSCLTLCKPHGLQPSMLLFSWGFSRQEYWSRLPCPPPGDLPDPVIKLGSSALEVDSLPAELPGKPLIILLASFNAQRQGHSKWGWISRAEVPPGTGTKGSCFAPLIEGHFGLEPEPINSHGQRQGLSSLWCAFLLPFPIF